MKINLPLVLVLVSMFTSGCCSIPRTANYKQLYSITKKETKIKTKKKFIHKTAVISPKDLRGNEILDEDIDSLKKRIEKYISDHQDLNDLTKNNLREFKITKGSTKEEVNLLLGEPDNLIKRTNKEDAASVIWVYRTNKSSVFTIVFIPVFFSHESYYLYFKNDILTSIERHYLEQTFYASDSETGMQERKKK
jgi:hypothetical protein